VFGRRVTRASLIPLALSFLSCPAKKRTKEGGPKRMLLPALPETNTTGKRTGLSTETQALLHGVVRFPAFTLTPARPFREPSRSWRPVPDFIRLTPKYQHAASQAEIVFSAFK